jgi:hypothetical protein
MTERKIVQSLYAFSTYESALRHIEEPGHNGEEGKDVVSDENQPPTLWHDWIHVTHPELCDHDHEGLNTESFKEHMDRVHEIVTEATTNPQIIVDAIQESLKDGKLESVDTLSVNREHHE